MIFHFSIVQVHFLYRQLKFILLFPFVVKDYHIMSYFCIFIRM